VENLFVALAQFELAYPEIQAQTKSIMTEAFPSHGGSGDSPANASAVIQQFTQLATEIESVWPDYMLGARALLARAAVTNIVIEDYYIQLDSIVPGRMHLFGRSASTPAPPAQWPAVTVNGQVWNPQTGSPNQFEEVHDSDGTIWWETSHDFTGVTDPVTFFRQINLCWENLDIRQCQTAKLSASVRRNASLVPGRETTKAFIYDTATNAFANPVIPLIQRAQLQPLVPGATLANTLQQIFDPIALVGQGLDTYMRVSLQYEYQLASAPSGVPLTASMPILLADDIAMGSSSPIPAIATEIAQETATWYKAVAPTTTGAVVSLQLTLFGTVRGQQLPLVQIGQIPILVGTQPLTWWEGPA
jgi:hypothetical protein